MHKNILLVSEENLDKIAIMADKISDMNPKPEIFATHNKSDIGNDNARLQINNELINRIASLE